MRYKIKLLIFSLILTVLTVFLTLISQSYFELRNYFIFNDIKKIYISKNTFYQPISSKGIFLLNKNKKDYITNTGYLINEDGNKTKLITNKIYLFHNGKLFKSYNKDFAIVIVLNKFILMKQENNIIIYKFVRLEDE